RSFRRRVAARRRAPARLRTALLLRLPLRVAGTAALTALRTRLAGAAFAAVLMTDGLSRAVVLLASRELLVRDATALLGLALAEPRLRDRAALALRLGAVALLAARALQRLAAERALEVLRELRLQLVERADR